MYKKLLSSFLHNYTTKVSCFSDFQENEIELHLNYLIKNLFFVKTSVIFIVKMSFFADIIQYYQKITQE